MDSIFHESFDSLLHSELAARTFATILHACLIWSRGCLSVQCWRNYGKSCSRVSDEPIGSLRCFARGVWCVHPTCRSTRCYSDLVLAHDHGDPSFGGLCDGRAVRPQCTGCGFLSNLHKIYW